MGYIVDVTIVLEVLFWFKVAQPRHPSLCEEDILAAFGLYQGSPQHLQVHQQIRAYVDGMTLLDYADLQDFTYVEVERLINSVRSALIDTIFSDAKRGPRSGATPHPSPKTLKETPPARSRSVSNESEKQHRRVRMTSLFKKKLDNLLGYSQKQPDGNSEASLRVKASEGRGILGFFKKTSRREDQDASFFYDSTICKEKSLTASNTKRTVEAEALEAEFVTCWPRTQNIPSR
jgi:hypothetical protein